MKALPIDPALATLMQVGHRVAFAEGTGPIFREWCVTDLPVGLWRADAAIEIPVPSIEAPPRPSGPCAAWLKVEPVKRSSPDDGPPWQLVAEEAKGIYGNWGGIPPDIQIACADFLTSWEKWRLRHLGALSEDGRWKQCEKAGRWAAETPGRSLWLKVKFRGDAGDHDLLIHVARAGDERILTLSPAAYAIEQPSCGFEAAMVDEIKRHPVGGLARGGADVVALQIVGREIVRPSPSALLMDTALTLSSLGLERGTAALRALNDPRARTGHTETEPLADIESVCRRLGAGDPWVFINSETPAELLSAALLARAEAGDRVLCVVPDESALMDVAIATAPWLPRDALAPSVIADKLLASLPPTPAISLSALEEDLRMVNERRGVLAASAGDRAKQLAEGPFIGEGAPADRMKRSQADVSGSLPAYIDGIDWRNAPPLTGDDAAALHDLLTVADCPERNLPPTEGIPPRAAIAKLAERTHGLEDGQWLIAELLDRGPPATGLSVGRLLVDRLERSVRAVDEAARVLPPVAIDTVFARLDGGLESLAEATLGATGGLIDYARRTAGHKIAGVAGVDSQLVIEAARRHHAALANPDPGHRWLRRHPSDQVPAPLRSVMVDGEPCTSVNQLRTLIEWAELELRSARADIPRLAADWNRVLGAGWPTGSPSSAFALHHLALLAREGRFLRAEIEHAATVFCVVFPMDAPTGLMALWVRILRALVDTEAEWRTVHQALDALKIARSEGAILADSLLATLVALDVGGVERHRGAIAAYHEHRAKLARRQALIEQLECAAPLWAALLRADDPSATTILDQFPQVWDLARVRAWQASSEAADLAREEAEVEALARRREELVVEIRTARLREALASARPSRPPIRVILASGIAQAALLDSGVYDLVVYWAREVFAAELYAAIRFAERAVVIGTGLASMADTGGAAESGIGRLRDRVGLIRVEG